MVEIKVQSGEWETLIIRCLCFDFQGLDTAEGLLLFGKEHFYILDGFTLVNGREVHDIDLMPANYYEPIIPVVPGQVYTLTLLFSCSIRHTLFFTCENTVKHL